MTIDQLFPYLPRLNAFIPVEGLPNRPKLRFIVKVSLGIVDDIGQNIFFISR
ncbi:hypothetical protein ACQFX9_23195 [Aliinostoc sp. HNIBRCY26]|uniref:hypothetical protein n=1 Tax=Aliinostoc sp. HNIBRCY26 TaxID=3418997 RepID=UPI003D00E559